MRILQLEKPVIGQRTQIGKAFDEIFKDMPIHKWESEQKQHRR